MTDKQQDFRWTEKATAAALALAEGKTRVQAAAEAGVNESSVYRWLRDPVFSEEVDRLTLITAIASRAERLRIVNRVVRQMVKDDRDIHTEKDLLDWLKYAQGETNGTDIIEQLVASFTPR